MLGEEGTDLARVIFGHSDPISGDLDLMLELLSHGVYIQFDLLGRVGVALRFVQDGDDLRAFMTSAGTATVAEAIPKLIEAGYADRVLLSQDVCTKAQLKRYGGTGYSFIHGKVPARNALPRGLGRAYSDDDGGESEADPDLRRPPGLDPSGSRSPWKSIHIYLEAIDHACRCLDGARSRLKSIGTDTSSTV